MTTVNSPDTHPTPFLLFCTLTIALVLSFFNPLSTVSGDTHGRGPPRRRCLVVRRGFYSLSGRGRNPVRLDRVSLFREQASRVVAGSARQVAFLRRCGGVPQGQRGHWPCPEQCEEGLGPDDVLRQDLLHPGHEVRTIRMVAVCPRLRPVKRAKIGVLYVSSSFRQYCRWD